MNNTLLLTCFFVGLLGSACFGQENDHEATGKHLVALTVGYTFVPSGTDLEAEQEEGFFVPTIGLDYMYKFHPKWEAGIVLDWELEQFLIFDKELERDRAFLTAIMIARKLTEQWNVQAGGGIEFEKNKNLAVFRCGTEYLFPLGK